MADLEQLISQLSVSIVHKPFSPEDSEENSEFRIESFIELKLGDKIISSQKIEPYSAQESWAED